MNFFYVPPSMIWFNSTIKLCTIKFSAFTTRKRKFNDNGFSREFVVKEGLQGISEETGLVVIRSS